jgi:hypothetical protein
MLGVSETLFSMGGTLQLKNKLRNSVLHRKYSITYNVVNNTEHICKI